MGWEDIFLRISKHFFSPRTRKGHSKVAASSPWLCSPPSCWELGTSREALISGHSVGRKRSRLCLHEHILMQLKQHGIKLEQWRISPQTQKQHIPCLWWAMMIGFFSVLPVSLVTSKLSNSAFPVWEKGLTQMSYTPKCLQWHGLQNLIYFSETQPTLLFSY